MMNLFRKLSVAVAFLALWVCAANAQMTDSQVIDYVKQGLSEGRSTNELGTELLAKGVTASQLTRAYQSYNVSEGLPGENSESEQRSRTVEESAAVKNFKDDDEEELHQNVDGSIFGHNIFSVKGLSFEPNENAATPSDYLLGPGDELFIDVWGLNEANIKVKISPEGTINLAQIGPVTLAGLTIEQAKARLTKLLSVKYSLSTGASRLSVTLGKLRTVKVNIIGEVSVPGTYRLSSLSTVFNALYRAGGITSIGTVRSIQLSRGGKVIETVDLYKFIFDGQKAGRVTLQDDDIINIPSYQVLVSVTGGLKRPMTYEMLPGESVGNLVRYAGGFSSKAFSGELSVQRRDAVTGRSYIVQASEYQTFTLQDGDSVSATENPWDDLQENRVEVRGNVSRPGFYAIGGEIATVRQLVEHAGGLLDNAFTPRAQLIREKSDRSPEVLSIAIGAVMNSSEQDIILRKNDVLVISNVNEIEPKGPVAINGYVNSPGEYQYAERMSVEDLILSAGGLKSGASLVRIDVSRRIVDPSSTREEDSLARIFSYEIKDGLPVNGTPSFTLCPYDIVSVRKSPVYKEQKIVRVTGEVLYPGDYTLASSNEKLSDIYARAGAATANAYIPGARLTRKFTVSEKKTRENLALLAQSNRDSANIVKMESVGAYTVGINLDKAIASPGGSYDVVLCDGDELYVPPVMNTVRIQGEVSMPNAVSYIDGKGLSYYVRKSGGFTHDALRRDVFVVYMNGQADYGRCAKILPGCEIVVPVRPARQKMGLGDWIGVGTSAVSLSTVAMMLVNVIKTK